MILLFLIKGYDISWTKYSRNILNTKKNKKTLKVGFKAIFNVHFANLVSKEYFPIQRLIIFLLYE